MQDIVRLHKEYNNKNFSKIVWMYDLEKVFLSGLKRTVAQDFVGSKHQKVLDVATGNGSLAYEFAKLGHEVIGIDISPDMLKLAAKRISPNLRLKFIEADATALPFPNRCFDTVSISFALHDMPYEIGISVLREMKRVLKDGGKLIILDYRDFKSGVGSYLTYPIALIYESKYYRDFVKDGLKIYIKDLKNIQIDRIYKQFLFQAYLLINK